MRVVRETCIAGRVIDITIKVHSGAHHNKRAARKNVTSEMVQKNNDRLAAKKLTRLINANFERDSHHFTLTYKTEPTLEDSQKTLQKFIRRVSYRMKKAEQEFKWIYTVEWKGHRIHHHFISNAPRQIIEEQWKDGFVFAQPFDNNPNRQKLAEYIIKESQNTFRSEETPYKARYSHSRNLIVPEVRVEECSERLLSEDPVAWKGYDIDPDSVRRYEHPITGIEHLEFVMIAQTEEPRLKRYYKGRIKNREENYSRYINYAEEQIDLWEVEDIK